MAELVDVQDLGSCGAIRVGSSPTARTKKKDTTYVVSFFLDSAGQRPASPFGIGMLGQSEFALRQGFRLRENACTAQKRRRSKGRLGDSSAPVLSIPNIDFNRPLQKGRHDPQSCLPFFVCDPRYVLFRILCRHSASSREVPLAKYALVHFTTTPDRRARAMRLGSAMRPFRVSAMSQTNSRSTVAPTTMTMTYRI